MDPEFLKEAHELKKNRIRERLRGFKRVGENADDERLFEELSFCVLTANTSAKMGIKSIAKIKSKLTTGSQEELAEGLRGVYRYPNKRSEYIVHNREKLEEEYDFNLREIIDSFDDPHRLRDWIVDNIKGIGYKEGSHFLRNIGCSGLCILDKHVLRSLAELGVIEKPERPRNREEYLEVEEKMRKFCNEVGIDVDEMDLLLWSLKNGEILK